MIKKLLVVMAVAALISFVSFSVLGMMGGFPNSGFGNGFGNGFGRGFGGPSTRWRDANRDPGPDVTRNLPYTGSNRLEIAYPADITVTQGTEPRFTVTGPQSLLDDLQLDDGVLESKYGPGYRYAWPRRYHGRLRIDVVTPNTHEFHLAGAEKLTIRNFDQESLILHIAGAADVEAQGRAQRLEAHLAGAGHLDLEQLTVNDGEVDIAGAGDASLDARRSAEVSIAGVGHVQFKCRPADTQIHTPGFGGVSYGPSCTDLPPLAAPAAPAAPAEPPAPPAPPAPKTKV